MVAADIEAEDVLKRDGSSSDGQVMCLDKMQIYLVFTTIKASTILKGSEHR